MVLRRGSRIEVVGDVALVELTQGRWATIDAEDVALVEGKSWYAQRGGHTWYAVWKPGRRGIPMHRLIAGTPRGLHTDHLDWNGLNNRRSNLRVCTHAENMANRRPAAKPGGRARKPWPDDAELLRRTIRHRLRRDLDDPYAEIAMCAGGCFVGEAHPCLDCLRLPASKDRTRADVVEFERRLRIIQALREGADRIVA